MAKAPQDPREIFQEITGDYRGLFGEDLVSIILYGSAAGKDYRPGKSDVNFMIVLSEKGIEDLGRALDTVAGWRKRMVATPLFLTEFYIETSLDVFPVEYLNFQQNHLLVYGKDVLGTLSFRPEHVRLQCEREIKGKLLLLREAYLETSGKAKAVREVIARSLGAFEAIFRALLFLRERAAPVEKREVIREMGEAFDLNVPLFEKLLDVKEEKFKPGEAEIKDLFTDYLREVRKLSKIVDGLGG
ncbi:MAG: hypothetical protein JW821_20335 [Deltaproteobacteria bacterium]|nr:hypothetical protein [Deltaproteobacteria bacterium]